MAEIVILLAVKKIGLALGNEATNQASAQFANHVTQLTELQGSMGRIMRALRVMHDFLCQMDIRNRSNQVYEGWLEEVQKVVHATEDMVDEYLYVVGQEQDVGWGSWLRKGFKKLKTLHPLDKIASMVKETEKNLTHLSQTKERWVPIMNSGDTSNLGYIVQSSQYLASMSRALDEEDLIGIEHNKQKLLQWLGEDKLTRPVIVLHGMGGLGKTALAAVVYKNEREKFDCHAWLSVSHTYTRQDILKRLIVELFKDKQAVPSNIATMDISQIQETLKIFLEQKKCLVILDDVWTPEVYTELSGALPSNLQGSRIIITTRIADVAHLALEERILTLERLSEDESWELFCKKAFPDQECPAELDNLSKQIVSKCDGLPLAIVSMGSLLFVRDNTTEEWKRIHNQLSWELSNNSRLDHVRNVLHLSFIYLPTNLKSCFLYCSLFPEDYIFTRKRLIRLWIAEGFVEERGNSTVEEVGEGYLKELIHRNMLQLVEKNSFGRIKKFRMHDILRELAVDLCQKDCFGVIYEPNKCAGNLEKVGRRLVVHKLNRHIQQPISFMQHLRSILTLDTYMPPFTLLPLVVEKCRYISVLELRGLPIEQIPDAIGDLFNLRYLGMRGSRVKILPNSIEKLSNLLTLDLFRTDIQELPRGIVKLKKLRHLFAEKANDRNGRAFRSHHGVCILKGLGDWTNLQTMQALEAQDESVIHLAELKQLRSFRIWNVKGIYCGNLCDSLVQMQFLSYLHINASDENEVLSLNALPPNLHKLTLVGRLEEGMLGESPFFQEAGQNLYSLCLRWSKLTEDPLPSFLLLSNLTDLTLTRAYDGEQLVFLTGWFPRLKSLRLRVLHNLNRLEIKEGAMTSLDTLILLNLRSMTEVPPGIEFLMPLQALAFMEITPDFLMLLSQCSAIDGMRWQYSLRD